MMIITDTASDIFEEEAEELGIHVVPLDISFGGEHFLGNTHEAFARFYQLLEERKDFPSTSQPTPESYLELYRQAEKNTEEVLVICLSGALSGTVESARMAAGLSNWTEHIHIMDTRHAIASQRVIVEEAVRLRAEGKNGKEILARLDYLHEHIRICGVLDSLEYLRRGGRIPAGLAVLGDLLNIKPVVAVDEGAVAPIGKVHGRHAGEKRLIQEFERLHYDEAYAIMFLYSKDRVLVDTFAKSFCAHFDLDEQSTRTIQIGPTIGAHLGPDCVGLCFVTQETIA